LTISIETHKDAQDTRKQAKYQCGNIRQAEAYVAVKGAIPPGAEGS